MPVSLTGHRSSVLGQGCCGNHKLSQRQGHYSGLGANNSEVGVYSACVAACSERLRPVLLATAPQAPCRAEGTPEGLGHDSRVTTEVAKRPRLRARRDRVRLFRLLTYLHAISR